LIDNICLGLTVRNFGFITARIESSDHKA